jgi:hypothetical protein
MGLAEVDARWQQLDPVFVRGMQRTGTSVMTRALQKMRIMGFGEGHLWFELVKPFERLSDPTYLSHLRDDAYALGQGRASQLEKYIAVALDQFHRDHLAPVLKRWMDKSPNVEAVRVVPLLARLFPRAQFIFMYRNGITCVHSAINRWEVQPGIFDFENACESWAATMSVWREIRGSLVGRYIEVAQEEMSSAPSETAKRLTDFLGAPEYLEQITDLFRSKRVASAFPDKSPGDYRYQIDWSRDQRAYFINTCSEEMEAWGYEIDFESPDSASWDVDLQEDDLFDTT